MKKRVVARSFLLPALALALVLPACADKEMAYTLPLNEVRVVPVQLAEAGYTPSLIEAQQGDRLLLQVENMAARTHYLTVKNPRGGFIRSVVLPAGETVMIPLLLTEGGIWSFYGEDSVQGPVNTRGTIGVTPRQ
jgi:hypothetical protein